MITSSYTKTGLYHRVNHKGNEDCLGQLENDTYLCVALADGVSTCTQSREGAQTAVDTVLRLFDTCGDVMWDLSNDHLKKVILEEVQYTLNTLSDCEPARFREYASTLAFAVYHKSREQLLLFSLGDSAIVTSTADSMRIDCRPDRNRSETATTTGNSSAETYVSRRNATDLRHILLLSDGGWKAAEAVLEKTDTDLSLTQTVRRAIERNRNTDDSSFIAIDF